MRFILVFLVSCSGAPSLTSDAAPAVDAGQNVDAGSDSSTRSAECLDQDQKLQAAIDTTRKSPNVLLAVKNEACGTSVYVSGDEKTAKVDSLWRIGSVTKTYVSASILSLVKDGKIALSDPLSKYVPNVANTNGVTVEMLLDHRSGIFNYTEDPNFMNNRTMPWTPQQIVYINQLHLTVVMLLTGRIKLVEKDTGKEVVVEDHKTGSQTCTAEQKQKVKELIAAYVKTGPALASTTPAGGTGAAPVQK